MTKHIKNASRVGILLDDEDKANAEIIARHYRTSNSGAVRIALAQVAERLRLHSEDATGTCFFPVPLDHEAYGTFSE